MPQGGSVPGPPPQLVDSALSEVVQSCLTLCDPMGCILPGSSVHGVFQARILEWVAISFSRENEDSALSPKLEHPLAFQL